MKKDDCIFCQIIAGEVPTRTKIYEDDNSFVFLSNGPANWGHALVLPKDHFENIMEIPDEYLAKIAPVIKRSSIAVQRATEAPGINVLINNGRAAGQAVFHAHFHILPRFPGDEALTWPEPKRYSGDKDIEMKDKIKNIF